MSTLVVDTLTNQEPQLCKAWVNFNGTGTVAIMSSYNVSSITDNGTGLYTVNFTNAMSDTNYVVTANHGGVGAGNKAGVQGVFGTKTASSTRVNTYTASVTNADLDDISVAVFR